ncbi:DALR anticodon-binding domain-containing protein 3 [Pectinophora gossypiella]|uniref:DALR anticodon-binding domain-containing protein 3 n=1 Tax=Pectinophora gossypiella TaxID=13191 RepID=UPI00214E4A49|nr:DALR anticodon-binding domain-containing protein 3 [Pectinophora gossypiella]
MLENALEIFSGKVFEFITNENRIKRDLLVKKHSEHLQVLGDFSFPNTLKSWRGVLNSTRVTNECDNNLLKSIGKKPEVLVEESQKWVLKVKNVKEVNDRIHLFLVRPIAIRVGLTDGLKNKYLISQKIDEGTSKVQLDPLCEDTKCITSLRLKHLTKSIQNLYTLSEECGEKAPSIVVSSKSTSRSDDGQMILCGTVLNSKTGVKECAVTADNFIKLRQNEMTLIAQHKYGVRVSTDTKWKEFIAHLGESAVVFELLQTKPSSAVKINFDHSASGSSKGAAFILYNCARLETIIKTYNDKVDEGIYPPLSDFESIDFSLLTQEDEWTLVFNYILGLPSLLSNCVEVSDRSCEFRPHHVCSFLSSMVRVFSQYYRKVRILTEPRTHLLPVMFARIHMLRILNDTLKTCLRILNIKSVSQM